MDFIDWCMHALIGLAVIAVIGLLTLMGVAGYRYITTEGRHGIEEPCTQGYMVGKTYVCTQREVIVWFHNVPHDLGPERAR